MFPRLCDTVRGIARAQEEGGDSESLNELLAVNPRSTDVVYRFVDASQPRALWGDAELLEMDVAGTSWSRLPCWDSETDYSVTFTILVGGEETPFTIHQDYLCRASDFFKKACTGDWVESKERTIRLAHVDAAIFQIYVEVLYYPSIDLYEALALSSRDPLGQLLFDAREHRQVNIVLQLCGLWVLGDYLQDYAIRNKVMDTLYARVPFETFGSVRIMAWLSAHTTTTSPPARLLRALFAAQLKKSTEPHVVLSELRTGANKLPADALVDLLGEVLTPTSWLSFCETHHVHPEGTKKCAQLRGR
ncbi:hypothetical protein LTR15_009078 [Elasticomyces elasticus]|nr:hypothetical protein LTR15_009078 [Elasticomyces elasticus]